MGKNRELMGNITEIFNGFRAINFIHKIFNLYFTAKSIDFLFLVTYVTLNNLINLTITAQFYICNYPHHRLCMFIF